MPEATQIMFKFTEIAELLVKKQDIHEGHWGLTVRFGINAANIALSPAGLLPTAIVPIIEMGIQRSEGPTTLTVDAAVVNPAQTKPAAKKRSVKKRG
jgi:hypothetical protein